MQGSAGVNAGPKMAQNEHEGCCCVDSNPSDSDDNNSNDENDAEVDFKSTTSQMRPSPPRSKSNSRSLPLGGVLGSLALDTHFAEVSHSPGHCRFNQQLHCNRASHNKNKNANSFGVTHSFAPLIHSPNNLTKTSTHHDGNDDNCNLSPAVNDTAPSRQLQPNQSCTSTAPHEVAASATERKLCRVKMGMKSAHRQLDLAASPGTRTTGVQHPTIPSMLPTNEHCCPPPSSLNSTNGIRPYKQQPATSEESHPTPNPSYAVIPFNDLSAEVIFLVGFYLDAKSLARLMNACKSTLSACSEHASWNELVLRDFGFKYENYMLFRRQTAASDWRRLYGRISSYHKNVAEGRAVLQTFPKILQPPQSPELCVTMGITMDSGTLVWENGTYLQALDISLAGQAEVKWCVRLPSQPSAAYHPKGCELVVNSASEATTAAEVKPLAIVLTPLFVFAWSPNGNFGQELCVFDLQTGVLQQRIRPPCPLDVQSCALDYSIRNSQVALLSPRSLHVWHADTLEFQFCLIPEIRGPSGFSVRRITNENLSELTKTPRDMPDDRMCLDFIWAGYTCQTSCKSRYGEKSHVCCQRKSKDLVLFLPCCSSEILILDANDGSTNAVVKGHASNILRVRQWVNPSDERYWSYYLFSMSEDTELKIWDSSQNFSCVYSILTGREFVFRLVVSCKKVLTLSPHTVTDRRGVRQHTLLTVWRINNEEIADEENDDDEIADDNENCCRVATSSADYQRRFSASSRPYFPSDSFPVRMPIEAEKRKQVEVARGPVLTNKKEYLLGPRVYFAEIIDASDLIALWHAESDQEAVGSPPPVNPKSIASAIECSPFGVAAASLEPSTTPLVDSSQSSESDSPVAAISPTKILRRTSLAAGDLLSYLEDQEVDAQEEPCSPLISHSKLTDYGRQCEDAAAGGHTHSIWCSPVQQRRRGAASTNAAHVQRQTRFPTDDVSLPSVPDALTSLSTKSSWSASSGCRESNCLARIHSAEELERLEQERLRTEQEPPVIKWSGTCEWEVRKLESDISSLDEGLRVRQDSVERLRCGSCGDAFSTSDAIGPSPITSKSNLTLCLQRRNDPWTLLDWKSFEISNDGSLTVFDFSPLWPEPVRARC